MSKSDTDQTPTSWKQLRVKTNLGVLASAALVLGTVLWQGFQINAAVESNSDSVSDLTLVVDNLAGAVSLANELDTRTNILFGEIDSLRGQYQEQADLWIEISTNTERVDQVRSDLDDAQWQISDITARAGEFYAVADEVSDLSWKVDDLERRVAEAFGMEMADDGGADLEWQVSDLIRQVAELHGRVNASGDLEWKLTDLENGLDWEIDELTRQVTELRVRMDTGGGIEQWQIDDLWNHSHDVWGRTEDLYGRSDEMYDMIWRLWSALETRSWSHDYLYN